MTLGQAQRRFTAMVGQLITWAYANGYELTYPVNGGFRTPEQAALNAKAGIGITDSLHCIGLAQDFNLFINGEYQTDSAAYKPLGEFWESIGGAWGGRFSKPDGNHFSLAWNGRK